tara:strand:- start:10 stop:204 length:195 start_codon:yes stop_codon:yes gene_type:complete
MELKNNKMITSYYIDDNKTLHTFIGDVKHVTFSNVDNLLQAKELIKEENTNLLIELNQERNETE